MVIKISGAYKLIDFIRHYQNGFFVTRVEIGYMIKQNIFQVDISQSIIYNDYDYRTPPYGSVSKTQL